jgi:hypothetical protein
MREFPNIQALLNEIGDLQQARDLLEEVWHALGPYFEPGKKLPPELESKLQRYFEFDDSE